MSYRDRGFSYNKHQVRYELYQEIFKLINIKNPYFITIAGLNEDNKYLINCGINPRNIITCDINNECIKDSESLGIIVSPPKYRNIIDCIKWTISNIDPQDIVNINMDFEPTPINTINYLSQVRELNINSSICYTYLNGRMNSLKRDELFNNNKLNNYYKKYDYHSKSENSNGSPMTTLLYRTLKE